MMYLNQIICGDNIELIKEIPGESINLIITSPPYYNQRDYGPGMGNEKSLQEYINKLLDLMHECIRIIKEDGSIVFNIGDKYINSSLLLVPYRFTIEVLNKEPLKLVNDITWVKLNPTPRQFKKRLVSSTEPFFHFVKSNNYYHNKDAFMGHLEIEKSSLSKEEKIKAKEELQNVIQEVKTGKIYSFRMKIRGIHSLPFGGQEGGRKTHLKKKGFTIIKMHGKALKRDIIESSVETLKGCKHPAIYPVYIIMELIRMLTREGDIVLDPFIGSGTTAIACKRLGRKYIGFEINQKYCKYAEERLRNNVFQPSLEGF